VENNLDPAVLRLAHARPCRHQQVRVAKYSQLHSPWTRCADACWKTWRRVACGKTRNVITSGSCGAPLSFSGGHRTTATSEYIRRFQVQALVA
jgi:hypothetical protein